MPTTVPASWKRIFLTALIASISLTAVLGIFAILTGSFGWLEVRILLTTLTVTAVSLCGLACGAVLERNAQHPLAWTGIALTSVTAVLVLIAIWISPKSESFYKSTFCIGIFAIACTHLALLSLARLAPRFFWAMRAAHVIIFSLAAILCAMVLGEWGNLSIARIVGVLSILDGAITIIIPILHRLSRHEVSDCDVFSTEDAIAEVDREIAELRGRLDELEQRRRTLVPPPRP